MFWERRATACQFEANINLMGQNLISHCDVTTKQWNGPVNPWKAGRWMMARYLLGWLTWSLPNCLLAILLQCQVKMLGSKQAFHTYPHFGQTFSLRVARQTAAVWLWTTTRSTIFSCKLITNSSYWGQKLEKMVDKWPLGKLRREGKKLERGEWVCV